MNFLRGLSQGLCMDDFTALYEKLAPYVIADSLRASAYEELPLEIKGRLKASIARLYAFWGHGPLGEERISRYSGFSAHEKMSPALSSFAELVSAI